MSDDSDIVPQLRARKLGKGILEKRAADEITRLRNAYKRERKSATRWRSLMHALPEDEALRLTKLADEQQEAYQGFLATIAGE